MLIVVVLFTLASNDVYGTIGLGILLGLISGAILSYGMKLNMNLSNTIIFWLIIFIFWIIIAFIFGILMHWLFCVKTELNNFLSL